MENSIIKKIYEEVSQNSEYATEEKEFIKFEDKEVFNKIIKPMYNENFKKGSSSEGLINSLVAKSEQFGFFQGFKCAMQLISECCK